MTEPFSKVINDIVPPDEGKVKSTDGTLDIQSKLELPISLYQKVNKESYASKLFEVSDSEEVGKVDETIQKIMKQRGLKDTVASYQQVINELNEILGLNENNDNITKLESIYYLLDAYEKVSKLFKGKNPLDILSEGKENQLTKLFNGK